MTPHEFFLFLLPEFDFIQLVFGVAMVLLVGFTIIQLIRQANPEHWEQKWQGDIAANGAGRHDVRHGSVNEISQSVASAAEQRADVMPGILLIIGLLGTFLGLGIALNKASSILIDANSAGMDSAMANLMGMMEGLGTKFKTSTWGISAFLLLKGWTAIKGYDEKRLNWCVQKVNAGLAEEQQLQTQQRLEVQQRFLTALLRLEEGITRQGEATRATLQKLHDGEQPFRENLTRQGDSALSQQQALQGRIGELHAATLTIADTLTHHHEHQQQHDRQRQTAVEAIRDAVREVVESNSSNLGAIQRSAQGMSDAAQTMGLSASQLQEGIGDFRSGVTEVLGTIKTDLGGTISQMEQSFGSNMEKIAGNMKQATDGISSAVGTMSERVDSTMQQVRTSIESSIDAQRASIQAQSQAQKEFIVTSETLNTKVLAMTALVEDLRDRILSGLSAVSKSSREVAHLNGRYETLAGAGEKSAEAIEKLVQQLALQQQISPLQPQFEQLNCGMGQLLDSVGALHSDLKSSALTPKIDELNGALEPLLQGVQALRSDVQHGGSETSNMGTSLRSVLEVQAEKMSALLNVLAEIRSVLQRTDSVATVA